MRRRSNRLPPFSCLLYATFLAPVPAICIACYLAICTAIYPRNLSWKWIWKCFLPLLFAIFDCQPIADPKLLEIFPCHFYCNLNCFWNVAGPFGSGFARGHHLINGRDSVGIRSGQFAILCAVLFACDFLPISWLSISVIRACPRRFVCSCEWVFL